MKLECHVLKKNNIKELKKVINALEVLDKIIEKIEIQGYAGDIKEIIKGIDREDLFMGKAKGKDTEIIDYQRTVITVKNTEGTYKINLNDYVKIDNIIIYYKK